jgi:hypothetical protein
MSMTINAALANLFHPPMLEYSIDNMPDLFFPSAEAFPAMWAWAVFM